MGKEKIRRHVDTSKKKHHLFLKLLFKYLGAERKTTFEKYINSQELRFESKKIYYTAHRLPEIFISSVLNLKNIAECVLLMK